MRMVRCRDRPKFVFVFGAENDYFWWFRLFSFSAKSIFFIFVFRFPRKKYWFLAVNTLKCRRTQTADCRSQFKRNSSLRYCGCRDVIWFKCIYDLRLWQRRTQCLLSRRVSNELSMPLHNSSDRQPVQTSFQVAVLQSFVDRLNNCSVPLVRSTWIAAAASLAKMQRSCCFCWTLVTDYRIAFIYSVNYWLQFIPAYIGVVYLIVFRIFTSLRERLRSIVMSMSVCLRGYLRNHMRDLYQFFVHVAYMSVARSSSGILTIGRIAYRREGVTGVHIAGEV